MQRVMQRFEVTKIFFEPTDPLDSPVEFDASATGTGVPDSFDEWLAQPSQTIAPGMEPDQGIFAGLINECQVRITHRPPIQPRQH